MSIEAYVFSPTFLQGEITLSSLHNRVSYSWIPELSVNPFHEKVKRDLLDWVVIIGELCLTEIALLGKKSIFVARVSGDLNDIVMGPCDFVPRSSTPFVHRIAMYNFVPCWRWILEKTQDVVVILFPQGIRDVESGKGPERKRMVIVNVKK